MWMYKYNGSGLRISRVHVAGATNAAMNLRAGGTEQP